MKAGLGKADNGELSYLYGELLSFNCERNGCFVLLR